MSLVPFGVTVFFWVAGLPISYKNHKHGTTHTDIAENAFSRGIQECWAMPEYTLELRRPSSKFHVLNLLHNTI